MRILIDTNIFIDLEKSDEISKNFAHLASLASKHSCPINVHPLSIEDLKRDKNSARYRQMISKIQKYPILDSPPSPDKNFSDLLGPEKKPNDEVDNHILYALLKNCSDILVTEDKEIHKKAEKSGLKEKVYDLTDAVDLLRLTYEKIEIEYPNVEDIFLYNVDINEEIFDSLKNDYPHFEKWFVDCQKEHRKAWICRDKSKKLKAILIYKDETDKCDFIKGKVLKICTFKVEDDFRGKKIGELFIKNVFGYCIANKFISAYVTVWMKHQKFIELMGEFGFIHSGSTTDGQLRLVKSFRPSDKTRHSPLEFHKLYSPYFISDNVNKFLVPITPQYHRKLFPESKLPQHEFSFIGHQTYSNALKKAYLCHARRELAPGDLLLFYRSRDHKILTTLGIVEKTARSEDPSEILSIVSKRTVFSEDEVKVLCDSPVLVILFRQIIHLSQNIDLKWIKESKIINNNLETITKISDKSFHAILAKSNDSIFAH